jgi:hypothetical protein
MSNKYSVGSGLCLSEAKSFVKRRRCSVGLVMLDESREHRHLKLMVHPGICRGGARRRGCGAASLCLFSFGARGCSGAVTGFKDGRLRRTRRS